MLKHKRTCLLITVMALLVLGSNAWAGTINGAVYQVQGNRMNVSTSGYTGQKLEGTFTASAINFQAYGSQTLADFLSTASYSGTGGGDLMSNCSTGGFTLDPTCYSTAITITGSGYFQHGTTYTITHDDGVVLQLQGFSSPLIDAPGPVYISPTSAVFNGPSGVYNYTIYYIGTNMNPEVLQAPNIPTPEPSSLLLLGSGMAAMIAGLRRKLRR